MVALPDDNIPIKYAFPYWEELGISRRNINQLINIFSDFDIYLDRCNWNTTYEEEENKFCQKINHIINKYQIDMNSLLRKSKANVYGCKDAKKIILNELGLNKIVFLASLHASGKSTILSDLESCLKPKKIELIDECWKMVMGKREYQKKTELITDLHKNNKPCLVAGAMLDKKLVDTMIYLYCPMSVRNNHLKKRYGDKQNDFDNIRLYKDKLLYSLDTITYGVQIMNADIVLRK